MTTKKIRVNVVHPQTGKRVIAITTGLGKGLNSEVITADGAYTTIGKGKGIVHPKDKKKNQ